MDERTLTDQHGVDVFTRWWPIESPNGVVLLSHGASEHSARYERFAQALNSARFAVVGVDHRGHGRSAAATGRGVMGPGGGMAVIDDLHELRAAARSEFGDGLPVFLFGHSMGSLIALAYLTHHADGLSASVLCGFPSDIDETAALGELLQGLAEAGMRDQPAEDLLSENNAPFEPARTNYDWLSRDPAEVDKYVSDPMCGDDNPLTYGYLIDLFDVVAPARQHLAEISCPVFVIAGDQDPAGAMGAHPAKLATALEAAGVETDVRLYEGARHELLNETNRDAVTTDIIDWFAAHR